ncbi:MAG: tetratricopeptide repeat protein [Flavobacteriaceae bacterium]|nr:tetratricopeptide repeat protein [Flavobacteriaceae bacterium]
MKKILLASLIIFQFTIGNAQQNNLLSVFETSYSHQANLDYHKAFEVLQKVYPNNLVNYELNLRLGWLSYMLGEFNRSEDYYTKAMELKPLSLEALNGKILPLLAQQKYDKVIQLSEKSLSISPNNSKAEYYIGISNYYLKDYVKSEKYLENAINKYPFNLDINLMLGWTKFALGKKNEAKVLFLVAQRNSPQNKSVISAIELINK